MNRECNRLILLVHGILMTDTGYVMLGEP